MTGKSCLQETEAFLLPDAGILAYTSKGMGEKILFVDDDPGVLEFYQDYLRTSFSIESAPDADQALTLLRCHGPYAVIVADMNMPGMNGIELLIKVQEIAPDTVRVMLTGDAEQQTAMMAINQGHIFQFLTKPCPLDALAATLRNSVKQHRLLTAERELLEHTLNGSIKMLTDILSTVEPQSFGKSQKIREYARLLAEFLKITPSWEIEMAAMLLPSWSCHDSSSSSRKDARGPVAVARRERFADAWA